MNRSLLRRSDFQNRVANLFRSPEVLTSFLSSPEIPDDLRDWLSRLRILKGVPFNYLVPDERMLPPESIRFFHVDMNWVDAVIDGAFSIGRNLTTDENNPSFNQDAAVMPAMQPQIAKQSAALRANALGLEPPTASLQSVSGFLLRSTVVSSYRGLGVEAYPDSTNKNPLEIIRLEPLGDNSDTLLCLVDGDISRVDIHEAPEHLHYGIDTYSYDSKNHKVTADKVIRKFEKTGNNVTFTGKTITRDISSSFRSDSPRVLKASVLAKIIAEVNGTSGIDSAEMGFEMTQGVGQVSFNKDNA